MLNKKTLKNTLFIGFALGLTACTNTDGLESKIATLTNQMDTLSSDVAQLRSQQQSTSDAVQSVKMTAEQVAVDVQKATIDAQTANDRIDNVVASYKK